MSLSQKLKHLRQSKGLTQQEMADKLSISRSTLAGYEAESKQPSYDVLVQIASFFEVSTDYLLSAGLFEDHKYHLITLYRDVILKKLYDEGLITKTIYYQLHECSMDRCIMFLSTIISDVSGDVHGIKYSYLTNLGNIGKQMYETLSEKQKEDLKYVGLETSQETNEQQELIDKLNDLSVEQQNKIMDYINMSYQIEKASLVAANERLLDDEGKSLPSSGTGGTLVG